MASTSKRKQSFDTNMLKMIVERDGCVVDFEQLKTDKVHVKSKTSIVFWCECGEEHEKTMQSLYTYGAFCKSCSMARSVDKIKETMMEKYGETCAFKVAAIKEKIKEINVEKYGSANVSGSQQIKDRPSSGPAARDHLLPSDGRRIYLLDVYPG